MFKFHFSKLLKKPIWAWIYLWTCESVKVRASREEIVWSKVVKECSGCNSSECALKWKFLKYSNHNFSALLIFYYQIFWFWLYPWLKFSMSLSKMAAFMIGPRYSEKTALPGSSAFIIFLGVGWGKAGAIFFSVNDALIFGRTVHAPRFLE